MVVQKSPKKRVRLLVPVYMVFQFKSKNKLTFVVESVQKFNLKVTQILYGSPQELKQE